MSYVELSTSDGNKFNANLFLKRTNDVSSDSISINNIRSEISNVVNNRTQNGGKGFFDLFSGDNNNLVLKAFGDKRPDVALYLINNGQSDDYSAQDSTGRNVLHYLVIYSTYDPSVMKCLMTLLTSGKDLSDAVNSQDKKGNTPAHYAADLGNSALVEALKTLGADLKIKNNDGFFIGTDTEQDTERIYSDNESQKNVFIPCGTTSEQNNLGNRLDNIVKMFVSTPTERTDTFKMSSKSDVSVNKAEREVSTDDIDSEAFIQHVLKKFKASNADGVPQLGGAKAKKTISGSRKVNTYSEFSFGGASENRSDSTMSEMARLINNQGKEVHERVVKKIMDIMGVDEKVARNYKAALYKIVKEKHPELGNYDRAVEMEKLATEKELKKIDIDKVTKEIEKHIAEKEKEKQSEEKPKKRSSKKKDESVSISTESSVSFSSTSVAY